MKGMAYDGDWKPFFEYLSVTLKRFASQRDLQKGEAFVHGFTLSQTCMGSFYLPISELDAGVKPRIPQDGQVAIGGYADIYLQPMLKHIIIITMQQEVHLLAALCEPGTIVAADGSCPNNSVFHISY